MVMMVMVTMVVVAAAGVLLVRLALGIVAMLTRLLQLNGHMENAMLLQLFPDRLFDFVRVCGGNSVKRCIGFLSAHAPNVQVMHIFNTLQLGKMLLQLESIQLRSGLNHVLIPLVPCKKLLEHAHSHRLALLRRIKGSKLLHHVVYEIA